MGDREVNLHAILHDGLESFEAKVNQIIILSYNLSTRTREIESVGLFSATKVMQFEY